MKWMLHLCVVTTKKSITSSAVVVPFLKTYVFHIVAHQLTATMSDTITIAHPGLQKMCFFFNVQLFKVDGATSCNFHVWKTPKDVVRYEKLIDIH